MRKKSSRRTFLRAAAAVPAVSCASAAPQETTGIAPSDALAEGVRLRYGQFFSGNDFEEIKRGIERMQRSAETLAKVKTTNSDAPDFLFHPGGIDS